MQYAKLGKSEIEVSRICLGTMTWGEQNTEEQAGEQMDYALEQGVNFWDTAELYAIPPRQETQGKTETFIGNWLVKTGKRDEIVLATKVAGPGREWIRGGRPINRAEIMAALDGSLKRLQTDYVDLYQLHWPNRDSYHFASNWTYDPTGADTKAELDNYLEVLQVLDELVKAGKIREVGLSNETAWGTMQYLRIAREHGLPEMATIQNEYSLLRRLYDTDMAEVSHHEGIGLLAYTSLGGGMLSGKYQGGAVPKGSRGELMPGLWGRICPPALEAIALYLDIAKKHGLDPCQMALSFVLTRPFTTSVIIGATTMEQLKTNICSIDVGLSQACLDDIADVYRRYPVPF